MLRIYINNSIVDVDDSIKIQITAINPIFSDSGYDEAYSFAFSLPATPKNKKELGILKEVNVRITFNNHQIMDGIGLVKKNYKQFNIDFKNESLDLRQRIEKIKLKELPLATVSICDPADAPSVKIQKWHDHMTQTTVTDSPGTGTHKFPFIKAWDDTSNPSYFTDWAALNPAWNFEVNMYYNGTFVKNVGWPSGEQWWTTVSPCVRIQYLVDQLFDFLNLRIGNDELSEVTEYQQMVHYSLLSLDKVEALSGSNYNVHGTEFDLVKFVPDLTGKELCEMLIDLFGVYFSYKNGRLHKRLKKNIIQSKPVDFSKYCNEVYSIEQIEKKSYRLNYDIDQTQEDRFGNLIWNYTVLLDSVYVTRTKHDPRVLGNIEEEEEKTVSYIPLQSRTFTVDRVYPSVYSGAIVEEIALSLELYIPFEQTSNHYDLQKWNEGGSNQWLLGVLRGNYPIYNFTHSVWNDRAIWCNSKSIDETDASNGIDYSFGTCSIYLNDGGSHVDVYLKKFIEYLRLADEITKTLYLPLHKILAITSWQEPNHIIKQRNLSFKGAVKKVNFTLYKNSISPVEITYAVVEKEKAGDFNDDFNDDYLV